MGVKFRLLHEEKTIDCVWEQGGKVFGLKEEEGAGGWRSLHNEELHNLYASPHVIKVLKSGRMRWAEHVERIREMINLYNILAGKSEGKRPRGRPVHR
jgi:hypothetical protein